MTTYFTNGDNLHVVIDVKKGQFMQMFILPHVDFVMPLNQIAIPVQINAVRIRMTDYRVIADVAKRLKDGEFVTDQIGNCTYYDIAALEDTIVHAFEAA